MSIADTLAEREKQHGSFKTHAVIENKFREIIAVYGDDLNDVQRCGLNMVFHKAARILNNGHSHIDSWHDIQGYAALVEKDMLESQHCPLCLAKEGKPHEPDCLYDKS